MLGMAQPSLAAKTMAAQKLTTKEANAGPATPAERGAMARAYVLKWGAYVQQVYKVPVAVWAKRMVPTFAGADASNFRRALQRSTYEGASAELSGVGRKLSDDQVIDTMARASLAPPVSRSQMAAAKLGDATIDLVYTPITPCRILDTRVAGGAISGTFSRDFNAVVGSGGNFSSQGGSATDCGGVAAGQAAAVINVTAVTPAGAGFATVYPFGAARPLASSVNYTAGAIVNNTVVTKLPNPLTTKDFTIYTFATSDFVADIVGYYAPPQATALDCATVSGSPTNVAAGAYASLPTLFCAANYTPVALSISAGENVLVADSYTAGNAEQIFVRSVSANAQNVTAKLMCCRVPGR
ncbi:MAG: hypothetical protein IT473_11110 [Lysobacter sp.]|nr:hypothetical protein [Lysobacter sp.]